MIRLFCGFLFIGHVLSVFANIDNAEDLTKPLFLTRYINNGEINEAKTKALVNHPQFSNTESYAGYLTINETYNSNTFFWYFPSQSDPLNDPLLMWMNGGPGSSSLFGLFAENGPFVIGKNGNVEMREYSWHVNHNIIFIDNPVGAGFSFTEDNSGYVTSQEDVGRDVLHALVQFFQLFPELGKNEFYLTGESYAGKYVLSTAHAIKVYNEESKSKINLKGLAIGNSWINPIKQMVDYGDTLFSLGLIDSRERQQVKQLERKIHGFLEEEKYLETTLAFDELFFGFFSGPSLFKNITGFDFFYNYLQSKEPEEVGRYIDWITKTHVRKALHVGISEFNHTSSIVKDYLKTDYHRTAVHYLEELLEDYKVLIFCGQLDLLVSCVGTERLIDDLNWPGANDFSMARKNVWKVDNDIAGFWKKARNLNSVLVRNGGHYLPYDQPVWAWDMITRFTRNVEF